MKFRKISQKCCIDHNEIFGRYVTAKEDIKVGETILEESPIVIIPVGGEKRCASCLKRTNKFCSHCQILPLCDKCNQHDRALCESISKIENLPSKQLQTCQEICGPLKCLQLAENSDTIGDYELLLQLEGHEEKRRNSNIWLEHYEKIVKPLLDSGLIEKLKGLSSVVRDEELLQKICSIIDVNCFEIRAPDEGSMRALYPMAALLAHNCVANTMIAVDDQYQMKIFANRDIRKGEIIYNCYTNPLLGTEERREFLRIGKYFHCMCDRCEDPTELGSHMSSFCCQSCNTNGKGSGYIIKLNNQWICQSCDHVLDEVMANHELIRAKKEILHAENDLTKYETFLMKWSKILHPHHYLIIDVKQTIAAIIRSIIMNDHSCSLTRTIYERKARLCEEIVEVLRIILPGISRHKAIAIYEQYNSFAALTRLRFHDKELSPIDYLSSLRQAEGMLRESLRMLLFEPINTPEGQLVRSMFKDLKDLQTDIELIKSPKGSK